MSRRPGQTIIKDPDSEEPQGFDWTAYLAELGDTIATSTYAVESDSPNEDGSSALPCLLTLSGAGIVSGNLTTAVTLTAGTPGVRYTVTNHITTAAGVEDDRSFRVLVQQR